MEERSNGKRLLVFVLIVAAAVGAWCFLRQSGAGEAIDETLDVFVPDKQEFNRRTAPIDQARQVTDLINSRQAGASGSE